MPHAKNVPYALSSPHHPTYIWPHRMGPPSAICDKIFSTDTKPSKLQVIYQHTPRMASGESEILSTSWLLAYGQEGDVGEDAHSIISVQAWIWSGRCVGDGQMDRKARSGLQWGRRF